MVQRMNPHHAITAPLGMMRYEEDGQYVFYTDYAALAASHEKLVQALKELTQAEGGTRNEMWSRARTALIEAEKLTK